jgi:hypothetical protein
MMVPPALTPIARVRIDAGVALSSEPMVFTRRAATRVQEAKDSQVPRGLGGPGTGVGWSPDPDAAVDPLTPTLRREASYDVEVSCHSL